MKPILVSLLVATSAVAQTGNLSVATVQTVTETRVSRTVFEYVMRASVTNGSALTAKGVTATCTSTSPRTTVVEGTLLIGNVAAQGSAASTDTFTIAHDRTVPFDPAVLQWTITKVPGAPAVTAPASPTNAAIVTLTGTAEPGVTVEITGITWPVTGTASGTGAFSIDVPLVENRINKLFVTALNATGRSEPIPVDIIHDAVAPSLFIDFPADGAQLTNDTITVAGRVGDMLSGFMGLNVTVNGQPANVAVGIGQNGTFERSNVPLVLSPPDNTITVVATDVNGNSTSKQITIHRSPITGPRMDAISGDRQTARIHQILAAPIVVKMTNADGTPFAGKVVTFNVTRSDGRLSATGQTGTWGLMAQVLTGADGFARAHWALGGDAGCGNNRVNVTSKDISGTIFFCASALAAPPSQINIGSGHNQRAEAGGLAPESLRAWVSDSCNGIAGVPVTFTVTSGGGKVNSLDTVTVDTATTGHASVQFTLGPDAGANTVEANYTGHPGLPATFTIYGLVRDAAKPTTFTGLVLDNTSQPIGGATCQLAVGGRFFGATTDKHGRFSFGAPNLPVGISDLPAGKADFYVNGLPATSLGVDAMGNPIPIPPRSFPSLSFSPTIVPNAENSLTSPVLLPRLNPNNEHTYDGTTDLVLTCEGIAGLKMTIKAGSMHHPNGSLVTPANSTTVSLNQVHADNVPMPVPDGASPPFAWTLQPAQCTFDPPIQIEYPNMSGLPAGSIAYFLTYNHDTEKFEIFASGHVTNDGSTILSDPGAGLSVSGWGCNCPPYSAAGIAKNCCGVAVVLFKGGVLGSAGDTLKAMAANLKTAFGSKVFTYVVDSSLNSNDAIVDATIWLDDQFAECPIRPKTLLIGHSLGGDTVVRSGGIPAEFRITLDPISRELAAARIFYQRPFELSVPTVPNLNYLSEDLSLTAQILCNATPIPDPFHCLRGFSISGVTLPPVPGTDHSTLVTSPGVALGVIQAVQSLLPRDLTVASAPRSALAAPVAAGEQLPFLDDTWMLSAAGQTVSLAGDGSFKLRNISAPDTFGLLGPGSPPDFVSDDYLRVIGVSRQDGKNRYVFTDFFRITQGRTTTIQNLTFTDTPPKKPDMLAAVADAGTLTAIGQTTQVRVMATYADKTTDDVTPATDWTTYRVSNPAIATVDANGLVTAKGDGIVYVTAVNEGVATVAQIFVSEGAPLTSITGFLLRPDGSAASGATVSISGLGLSATVGADGRFAFTLIPANLGVFTLSAVVVQGNTRLVAVVKYLNPIVGGVVDAGILTLAPFQQATAANAIAAGETHSVALKTDGSLWAWGRNERGQLGDGTLADRRSPVRVDADNDWAAVASGGGGFHTMALKFDGSLWAWGENGAGQLGDGTTTRRLRPVRVGSGNDWAAVAGGFTHTVALKVDGSLWAWGANNEGQLGDGITVIKRNPVRIGTSNDWATVAAGLYHTVAVQAGGSLWTWGRNTEGQLGNGTTVRNLTPMRIGSESDWKAVGAGYYHTVALKSGGKLFAWGRNNDGAFGDGTSVSKTTPVQVGADSDWAALNAGVFHTVALKRNGSVWAWGGNGDGQLGDGSTSNRLNPVRFGTGNDWAAVSGGAAFTLALKTDGRTWAWGRNFFGQLGDGSTIYQVAPTRVGTASNWKAVAAGDSNTIALRTDGSLWAWGENLYGQVGDGTTGGFKRRPVRIGMSNNWAAISSGWTHSVAVRADGTLWSWGNNAYAQLGDGTQTSKSSPAQIDSATNWASVAAGHYFTLARKTDNSLWAWGYNFADSLGDGLGGGIRLNPVRIGPDNQWPKFAAGAYHMVAVNALGNLFTWGNNFYDQLGNGGLNSPNIPERIGNATDWISVAAGQQYTLALKSDNSLWAWGDNVSTPTRKGMATDWLDLAAGGYFTIARKLNQSLWAWGGNGLGQLGDGSTVNKADPVQIASGSAWTAVAAGLSHAVAIKTDSTLWAWGDNSSGQLGIDLISISGPIAGEYNWGLPLQPSPAPAAPQSIVLPARPNPPGGTPIANAPPSAAASALRITPLAQRATGAEFQFPTEAGARYRLEGSADLQTWTVLLEDIAGTGGVLQVRDPAAATFPRYFYRVRRGDLQSPNPPP